MRIAVDAMGGDHAPRAAVEGACRAAQEGLEVVLVGQEVQIREALDQCGSVPAGISIQHASEVVGMDERAVAVRQKRDASVRVCARLVWEGKAHAMVTAGHTGAALIAAKTILGGIPGVARPALAAVFPSRGGQTLVLDVGANLSAKASHLREFAVMGHFYAQEILGTQAPRIGLMSVGQEEGKGTQVTREGFRVLQSTGLQFVGNVEGRDVFGGAVDVIVCDGFVGNVMLKSCEALAGYLSELLLDGLSSGVRQRLASGLLRPLLDDYRQRTDWSERGAAPLLGVQGGCLIGHGRSGAKAFKNAVLRASEFAAAELHEKIRVKVVELHAREEHLLGASEGYGKI